MKKNLFLISCMALTVGLGFTSCKDDEPPVDPVIPASLELSSSDSKVTVNDDKTRASVNFDFNGGTVDVTVTSSLEDWTPTPTGDTEWFTVSKTGNTLKITAPENTSTVDSYAMTIEIETGEDDNTATATISVTQGSTAPAIIYNITDERVSEADDVLTVNLGNAATKVEGIVITSNFGDWSFTDEATDNKLKVNSWLTATKDLEFLILNTTKSSEFADRSATFTLSIGEGDLARTVTVIVNQEKLAASLTIAAAPNNTSLITIAGDGKSASNDDFTSNGGSFIFTVTSAGSWSYSLDNEDANINSVTVSGTTLTYTIQPNGSGQKRDFSLTIHSGIVGENYAEATVTVKQRTYLDDNDPAVLKPMIMKITTTEANQQVYLPLYGAVNCDINWGDGSTVEHIARINPTVATGTAANHTYSSAGTYNVEITGTVTGLNTYRVGMVVTNPTETFVTYITGVSDWGYTKLTSMEYAFYNCSDLVSLPADDQYDAFKDVTTFSAAFRKCTSITSTSFTKDTFKSMGTGVDCSLANIFYGCTSLTTVDKDLFANSPRITSFTNAFQDSGMTTIPEDLFAANVNATTFAFAFSGCKDITTIPANLFANNTAATSFANVFQFCENIAVIPANLFANNAKVTAFDYAFQGCTGISDIPESLFANNTAVTGFGFVFQGCTGLSSVSENLFANNAAVTSFASVFNGCTGLVTIPSSIFDKNKKVLNFNSAFSGCTSWVGESPYFTGSDPKIHIYERAAGDGFSEATPQTFNRKDCFKDCKGLTDYLSIPSNWGGGGPAI